MREFSYISTPRPPSPLTTRTIHITSKQDYIMASEQITEGYTPIRCLVFAASLREGSYNKTLSRLAVEVVEAHGGITDVAEMRDFDCPSYDQDVESNEAKPRGAQELHDRILANDAIIIASPEYNGSMPGVLKNTIDWVSRFRPQPFNEKHILLMSASPSMGGGNKALWSLRVPLEHLGARVFPDMFSLATAHKALSDTGKIIDPKLATRFDANIASFMELAEAAKNYPCMKKAWVEFLGETTDEFTERVE